MLRITLGNERAKTHRVAFAGDAAAGSHTARRLRSRAEAAELEIELKQALEMPLKVKVAGVTGSRL
jgi:hypothetical protein